MPPKKDLIGQKFGRLRVIKESGKQGRYIRWECRCDCGKIKRVITQHLMSGDTRSCGCLKVESDKRRGSKSRAWRGGRRITGCGYILLLMREHPDANSRGLVSEHKIVMEAHLGRSLNKNETVHHKNGIRTDNRIKNLELRLKNAHPPGQSIQDLIPYWKDMLQRYAPYEPKEE